LPFTVDLHFGYRNQSWTSEEMSMSDTKAKIEEAELKFNQRFEETFVSKSSLSDVSSGFLKSDSSNEWTQSQLDTAKYGLGNMLGSVAYMYGDRLVYQDGKVVT
jgi:hypothetical protein